MCKGCRVVKRRGKIYVVCKRNPRHKQRQGIHTNATASVTTVMSEARATAAAAMRPQCAERLPVLPTEEVIPFGAFAHLFKTIPRL